MASWILLSMEITSRGLEISARDSDGKSYPAADRLRLSVPAASLPPAMPVQGIWIPRLSIPPPMAVLVSPPAGQAGFDWEGLVRAITRRLWGRQIPVARYVPPATGFRDPFRLPMKLITLGASEPFLRAFRRHAWVNEAMRLKGLEIQHLARYGDLASALHATGVDAVVCADHRLTNVLSTVGEVPLSSRPELILSYPTRTTIAPAVSVPPGTAIYQLPVAGTQMLNHAVDVSLQSLLHAYPVVELPQRTRIGGILHCGPDTMTLSRFPEVAEQVQSEANYLESVARTFEIVGPETFDLDRILGKVAAVREQPVDPTAGPRTLVKVSGDMRAMHASARDIEKKLPRRLDKEARETLRANQRRKVDFELRRLDATPVPRGTQLEAGSEYRLWVQIGGAFQASLLVSEPTSIDPALRNQPNGHQLDVVLFPKNVTVKGPLVRRLFLPEIGPSEAAWFGLQVPDGPDPVEARVAIYHQNQQLQNFLFVADKRGARMILQFSQTARFQNLDQLGQRALSLTMNKDVSGRTHRIMVFNNGEPRNFEIPETLMTNAMESFRAFLKDATGNNPSQPRFATYPEEGEAIAPEFHQVLRDAIDLGAELYGAFEKDVAGLVEELKFLRGASNQPVQLVRLHRGYVYPWTVFYDWDLPDDFPGTVCTGVVNGQPCGHHAESEVYCVNGFWAIRHVLEEFIHTGPVPRDASVEQPIDKRCGAILLAADETHKDLETLTEKLSDIVRSLDPSENLLQKIWDKETPPVITIIYGHTETELRNGRRRLKRITLPGGKGLSIRAIDQQKRRHGELPDPRPAILLLACDTALMDTGMVNDFVSAFHHARAAVILGTESIAFRSLLARFGREMTLALAGGQTLGDALRSFRRTMLAAGNPMPFVFHAVGSAGFQLKWRNGP